MIDAMKTTNDKIEKLNKAGKILSRIFFLLSALAAASSLISIVYVYLIGGPGERIKKVLSEYGCSPNAVYPLLTSVIICLIGEIIVSSKAEKYFILSLESSTPFTLKGAENLFHLALYCIIVPIVTYALSFLILYLSPDARTDALNIEGHFTFSISLGIMFIITSLLLKSGYEEIGDNNV